ncbi:MAG: alpha/beta fold hydrolase [Candidatus Micrarchaeota archaeon]
MRFLVFSLLLASMLLLGCSAQQPTSSGTQPPASGGVPTSPPPKAVEIDDEAPEAAEPESPAPGGTQQQPLLESEEVSYNAGAWKIYGTLYPSRDKTPDRLVILVPMLGHTRGSYPQGFIKRVHDELPDALILSIDPKGHGQSVNLGTWMDFETEQFKDMRTDIIKGVEFIAKDYPNVEEYYVVGASMGSTSALLAGAQKNEINKIVMISPGMDYQGVEIENALDDYTKPLLVVAASGDSESAQTAQYIDSSTPDSQTTKKVYLGLTDHGTALFDATASYDMSLEDEIVQFLK